MTKPIAVAGVVSVGIIAALLGWYWASPFFAVAGLRNAAISGDTQELGQRADFAALREGVKAQFSSVMIGSMTENLRGNPFAALGVAIAAKLTDVMVDALITPAGIAGLVESQRKEKGAGKPEEASGFALMFSNDFVVQRQGVSTFDLQSADDREKNPTLRFNRDGLGWRLVGLQLPKEFMSEKIGNRVGANRQPERYVPKWEIHERRDPMDDTVTVALTRGADEEVSTRFTEVRPILIFRCRNNKVDAFFNVKSSVDYDYRSHTTNVRLRFDDNLPTRESWAVSDDREAVFAPNPGNLINSLLDAATLQFEWRQIGGGSSVAKFSKDDFGNHAAEFASKCGKPELVRK